MVWGFVCCFVLRSLCSCVLACFTLLALFFSCFLVPPGLYLSVYVPLSLAVPRCPRVPSSQPLSHVSHEFLWAFVLPVDWTCPLHSAFVGLIFLFLASPPQSSINLVCFVVELLNCISSLSRVCMWVQPCFWCLRHTNRDTSKLCIQVQYNLLFFDTPASKNLSDIVTLFKPYPKDMTSLFDNLVKLSACTLK